MIESVHKISYAFLILSSVDNFTINISYILLFYRIIEL